LDTLRSEIQREQGVRGALACYGVLKLVENPLMRVGEPLLLRIVIYWDSNQEVFVVHGHKIEFMLQDIYFLTGLAPIVVVGDIHLVLPRERNIQSLWSTIVHGVCM